MQQPPGFRPPFPGQAPPGSSGPPGMAPPPGVRPPGMMMGPPGAAPGPGMGPGPRPMMGAPPPGAPGMMHGPQSQGPPGPPGAFKPPVDQMGRMSLGHLGTAPPPMPGSIGPPRQMSASGVSLPPGARPHMPSPLGAPPSGGMPPPGGPPGGMPPQPHPGMTPPPMANGHMGPPGGPPMMRPPGPGFGPPGSMPPPGGMHPPMGPQSMPGKFMPPPGVVNAMGSRPGSASGIPQAAHSQNGAMPGRPGMIPPPGGFVGAPQTAVASGVPQQQSGMQRGGPPASSTQNRIDPASMPRPPETPVEASVHETRVGGVHMHPPPATWRYQVRDRGSAGPRYMRSTMNQIPANPELLNNSSIPFSVMVAPMALPGPGDDMIQIVDLGELGPVRCTRCGAYMNPFMRFTSQGKNFTCNMCGLSNVTPEAYYSPLGHDGRRQDLQSRPELQRGSVEYVATAKYSVRPPMQPAHVFVIDASQAAVSSGALAVACSAVSSALEDLEYADRTLVSILTFDSVMHFYAIRPSGQIQMLVVGDTSDIFAPQSAPLLVNLAENKDNIMKLLEDLPNMHKSTQNPNSCAGAAVEAAVSMLSSKGGKIHTFLSSLPNCGLHTLKPREVPHVGDKDKLVVLQSQDNTLKSLATTAADFQIAVDIALLGQGYLDAASWGDLVSHTGGTLYTYPTFNPVLDVDQVLNDLKWNVSRPQALEAVMRVRCSQGLDVTSYTGHFARQANAPSDVYLPAVDCDKAVLANINITEKMQAGHECYLQAALLYTAPDGCRRIRVHTIALPITDNISAVFKGADLDTYMTSLNHRIAATLPGNTLAIVRDSITQQVVSTLYAYRKHCASNTSSAQLILPEALKVLPLYALAMLKGPALRDGAKPDERSAALSQMMCLVPARSTPLLYPRLISFHALHAAGGIDATGGIPAGLWASAAKLEQGGVYLLENGRDALLFFDKDVDPGLLQELVGVSSYEEFQRSPPGSTPLLPRDTPASRELQNLLTQVRIHRSSFMRMRVARKGDVSEAAFYCGLVEDRSTAGVAYVDYLCEVHKMIQDKLAKG